jgi:hypothetical protein
VFTNPVRAFARLGRCHRFVLFFIYFFASAAWFPLCREGTGFNELPIKSPYRISHCGCSVAPSSLECKVQKRDVTPWKSGYIVFLFVFVIVAMPL